VAAVDSEAFFDTRMQAIGLSSVEQIAVRAQGWLTLANFAFASSWTPGQSGRRYDKDFMDRVIVLVLGDPRHTSGAKLRRLMFGIKLGSQASRGHVSSVLQFYVHDRLRHDGCASHCAVSAAVRLPSDMMIGS
jgi:hypothetical protein